jgi:hypothetical protein
MPMPVQIPGHHGDRTIGFRQLQGIQDPSPGLTLDGPRDGLLDCFAASLLALLPVEGVRALGLITKQAHGVLGQLDHFIFLVDLPALTIPVQPLAPGMAIFDVSPVMPDKPLGVAHVRVQGAQ